MISTRTHIKTKLDTSGLEKLKGKLKKIERTEIEWGYFGGVHSGSGMTYAALAFLLEFGRPATADSGAIPARPAFRQSIQALRLTSGFDKVLAKAIGGYIRSSSEIAPDAFLKPCGAYLAEHYASTMRNWVNIGTIYRHNAPMTIELKGFDQPFVETGELVQAVDYQIN